MNSITGATFFGSNYKIAQSINREIPLLRVYCEPRSFNREIHNFCSLHGIELVLVEKRRELEGLAWGTGTVGISCGFGIIFQQPQIDAFEHGIWNIHYGKLPDIRGRHPISWAFLRNDQQLTLTIHEINTEIDQGSVLAEGTVWRDLQDTQQEIEAKFETLLAEGLLREAIENYLVDRKQPVAQGNYYESMVGKFADLDPAEHDACFIYNLFQSQAVYGGVTVAGQRYTECAFYHSDFPQHYAGYRLFVCRDGVQVALK